MIRGNLSKTIQKWLNNLQVGDFFVESGSPCENGYNESFNGKLREERLNREIFTPGSSGVG